ncbi:MAG: hypothetical protein MI725_02770 [Pirellulales bacterium]|nr:hypothetical protein [Pirellulales bacterium]
MFSTEHEYDAEDSDPFGAGGCDDRHQRLLQKLPEFLPARRPLRNSGDCPAHDGVASPVGNSLRGSPAGDASRGASHGRAAARLLRTHGSSVSVVLRPLPKSLRTLLPESLRTL